VDTKLLTFVAVQINMLSSDVSYILLGNIKSRGTVYGGFV
jgi:hypothetical protein